MSAVGPLADRPPSQGGRGPPTRPGTARWARVAADLWPRHPPPPAPPPPVPSATPGCRGTHDSRTE